MCLVNNIVSINIYIYRCFCTSNNLFAWMAIDKNKYFGKFCFHLLVFYFLILFKSTTIELRNLNETT